jgi:SagB-type dehydrogenase family enzyme
LNKQSNDGWFDFHAARLAISSWRDSAAELITESLHVGSIEGRRVGTMKKALGVSLLVFLVRVALSSAIGRTMVQTKSVSAKIVQLPAPEQNGKMSVEEALARRRSVREFRRESLTERELSQLLWAAQGITHPDGLRTAPSAGALYPLEIYVATSSGFYHYQPRPHRLIQFSDRDPRALLRHAALDQEAISQAPTVFVIAAVYERTSRKYGAARTPRYVHMEVGHAAENLLLEAVALGLGGVTIGAFDDNAVRNALALPADCRPLYLVPVGHPR